MRLAMWLTPVLMAGCPAPAPDGGTADMAAMTADLSKPVDFGPCGNPSKAKPGEECLIDITGKIIDEQGQGIGKQFLSACAGICIAGNAKDDGTFALTPNLYVKAKDFALLVHGCPELGSYAVRLPPLANGHIAFPQPLLVRKMPTGGPTLALDDSAQTQQSGDVTLTLEAGTQVVLNECDDPHFQVLTVADPKTLPFIDPAAVPDLLYGFSPYEVHFTKKLAQLSFKNTPKWPKGTTLDVLSLQGLLEAIPAGGFEKVATAHISDDEKSIVLDQGQGISYLTWIALKKTN